LAVFFLVLSFTTTMGQDGDLYLRSRRLNGFTADGFVDPPKNGFGALYYYGDDPEFEVILINRKEQNVSVQWATADMVTPVFREVPTGKLGEELRFKQLNEHPVVMWREEPQTTVRETSVSLPPENYISLRFRVVTETGEKPPPGDYAIEVGCQLKIGDSKEERAFKSLLAFEIREPNTLPDRVCFISFKAMKHFDEKNYTAAEKTIREAIELYPPFSAGYSLLGYFKEHQGQDAEALKYYERALELLKTKQDYLGTRHRGQTSIEHTTMPLKNRIKTLREKLRQKSKPR
jgi:hypothetical protein